MARRGSFAKLGVVFLAPVALGLAIVGLVVGATGHGLREHGPTHDGWMATCFVAAGLVLVWWLACIVRVWTTRERDGEPIPRAKAIERT
jgi:hypothetical protein